MVVIEKRSLAYCNCALCKYPLVTSLLIRVYADYAIDGCSFPAGSFVKLLIHATAQCTASYTVDYSMKNIYPCFCTYDASASAMRDIKFTRVHRPVYGMSKHA